MGKKPLYEKDASHPAITVDLNKCIFCQRCMNSCAYDALELSASGFDEKGRAEGITLVFNEKCVSCGKCVDNCSTGALNKKEQIVPMVNEVIEKVRTTCPYCGTGCQLELKVTGNTLMEVTANPDQMPNYGDLCVKGRFGHSFLNIRTGSPSPLYGGRRAAPGTGKLGGGPWMLWLKTSVMFLLTRVRMLSQVFLQHAAQPKRIMYFRNFSACRSAPIILTIVPVTDTAPR